MNLVYSITTQSENRKFPVGYATAYRFGFNGMERDDEAKGSGNSYDFGARIYDSRLGRWLSVDAKASSYPDYSPYNYSLNSPLMFGDPDGNWVEVKTTRYKMIDGKKVQLKGFKSWFVKADIIEKQVTVHNMKLIDLTGSLTDNQKADGAKFIQQDIEKYWNSKNNKDEKVDENGYVTNSRNQKIKMVVTFAEPITVVQSKSEIKANDNPIAIVNDDDLRLTHGAATVDGAIMYIGKSYLDKDYPTLPAHEFGHLMHLADAWMDFSSDRKKIMYNRRDRILENYPTPNEYKQALPNFGIPRLNYIDLSPSPTKTPKKK